MEYGMYIKSKKIPSLDQIARNIRPIKIKCPEKEKFDTDILAYFKLRNFKYLEESDDDVIDYNDIVQISCKSSLKKFDNDNIQYVSGRHVFDKEIEEALFGMKKGQKTVIEKEGSKISLQVISIIKKYYGEVSFEDIKKENPKVKNVDEFLNVSYQKKVNELVRDKVEGILLKKLYFNLYSDSYIEIEEKMLKKYTKKKIEEICSATIGEEYSSPEDKKIWFIDKVDYMFLFERYDRNYNEMSDEELDQLLHERIYDELKLRVISDDLTKKSELKFNCENYEEHVKWISEIYGLDLEFYKERYTYEAYKFDMKENFIYNVLNKYAREKLIKLI